MQSRSVHTAMDARRGSHGVRLRRGQRAIKAVKGEVHNVLSLMRRQRVGSSRLRFLREVTTDEESEQLRRFKDVHELLQHVNDLDEIDASAYLHPFLLAIRESGAITAVSIASVNKFLLYGILSRLSRGVRPGSNQVAATVAASGRAMASRSEIVSMKTLELMVHCVRSDCGPLLTDDSVWQLFEARSPALDAPRADPARTRQPAACGLENRQRAAARAARVPAFADLPTDLARCPPPRRPRRRATPSRATGTRASCCATRRRTRSRTSCSPYSRGSQSSLPPSQTPPTPLPRRPPPRGPPASHPPSRRRTW